MPSETVIIVLTEHRRFGYLFVPYLVAASDTVSFFNVIKRITEDDLPVYATVFTELEKKIIRVFEEYNEKNISRFFLKKKDLKNKKTFKESIPDEIIEKNIRPYIEKRLVRCVNLLIEAAKNNLPYPQMFFKNNPSHVYRTDEITMVPAPAEAVFNFIRTEAGIKYFLSLKHEDTEIKLTCAKAIIVNNNPCYLVINNCFRHFKPEEGTEIDGKKLIPFFSKEYISIPVSSEKKYFETFVLNSIIKYRVNATGFDIINVAPLKKALLSFEKNLENKPVFILTFMYDNTTFLANEIETTLVTMLSANNNFAFNKLVRDAVWEEKEIAKILQAGFISNDGVNYFINGTAHGSMIPFHDAIVWLNEQQQILTALDIEIIQHFRERYNLNKIYLNISAESRDDWFDIKAWVNIGNFKIPFMTFRKNILEGIREFILPNEEIAVLPYEWFHKYSGLMLFVEGTGPTMRLKKHHVGILKDILELETESPKSVREKLLSFWNDLKTKKTALPIELNATLRDYQREGFNWLYSLHESKLGGCLADDMGLGKTIQTLSLLLKIKTIPVPVLPEQGIKSVPGAVQLSLFETPVINRNASQPVNLVVVPTSLVHNWQNEIAKFAPSLNVYKYVGSDRNLNMPKGVDVVLSTYGTVRNDIELLRRITFNYIVLDESQYIKNPDSKIYQAIVELNSLHKLALTGTPVENSLSDLWAQFNFLNKGMFGSLPFFRDEFITPIEKNQDTNKQKKLQQLIHPFILRRTKEEVAPELPSLTEQTIVCEMTEEQRFAYESEKSKIRNVILENISNVGVRKSTFVVLQGLTKLRQMANHPVLLYREYTADSGKFDEITRNIENIASENHKVLVFSSFVKHLDLIAGYLETNNYRYSMLTGKNKGHERESIINSFQNDRDIRIFLVSLKAGGVGLNLTAADYIFIIDPWWNPAAEDQAISRAHRIGQDKKVFAYRFITKNTIEEKINTLQKRKSDLADIFINSNNPIKNANAENIMDLFV